MNCARLNCQHAATCYPVLTFTPEGHPESARGHLRMLLPLCDEHAFTEPTHFINDEGWAELVQSLRTNGQRDPDRASLRVQFEPWTDEFQRRVNAGYFAPPRSVH